MSRSLKKGPIVAAHLLKKVEQLNHKVDSLSTTVVNKDEMINILQSTTMWQTLIIEELSDKDHMPINHYRSESGK